MTTKSAKPSHRMRWALFVAFVVIVSIALLAGTGAISLPGHGTSPAAETKEAKATAQAAVTVTVAPVQTAQQRAKRPIQRSVDVVGSFQGFEELIVTPKVSGRVIKIHHDVEDIVRTGELLLEIDPTDYQHALEEAQRAMASELAKVGIEPLEDQDPLARSLLANGLTKTALKRPPPESIDLDKLIGQLPSVIRAEKVEENARRRFARAAELHNPKTVAISSEDYDQIETDLKVAKASREQVILDAKATLATARQKYAQLRTAEQRLSDTRVEVPAAKIALSRDEERAEYAIAERMISEGEMSNPGLSMLGPGVGKGIFRLVLDRKLKVLASVPERYAPEVRKGQTVELRTESYPDKVFLGQVSRISPAVDRTSRTFPVEVVVPNDSRQLKTGGFAKLAILTRTDNDALTVSAEAVTTFAGVNKVFVVQDGKAHVVNVSLGYDGRTWWEVIPEKTGALTPGMLAITTGHSQLAEGTAVQVREEGAALKP